MESLLQNGAHGVTRPYHPLSLGHFAVTDKALENPLQFGYYCDMTETVSFKLNRALLVKLDGLTNNRSDFIREAVEEKVRRTDRKSQSAWSALQGTAKLNVNFPPAKGKVKRVDL